MTAANQTDFMAHVRAGRFVLMDGAMGTELERRGVPLEGTGWSAAALRDYRDTIREVHEDYIEAGAKLHIVNSFALARHVLEPLGLGHEFEHFNREAVNLFNAAVTRKGVNRDELWAAGSLSTFAANSDRTLLPSGDALVSNYRDQAQILFDAGVDLFALEMLFDVEVSLAMLTAVEGFGLPVIMGLTCDWDENDSNRVTTSQGMGGPVTPFEEVLSKVVGAAGSRDVILSIMHSGADVTDAALEILHRCWDGPVAIYPNSGHFIDLRMQFDSVCSVNDFQQAVNKWIATGVRIIGGCCGIGPAHIRGIEHHSRAKR